VRLSSTPSQTVYYDGAYAPYGESYAESGTIDHQFTGLYQDTVGDLYDFPFREYHSTQGRWLSPDPAGLAAADPTNPQSLNRYAYVLNNPLSLTDPLGLQGCPPGTNEIGPGQCAGPAMNPKAVWQGLQWDPFDLFYSWRCDEEGCAEYVEYNGMALAMLLAVSGSGANNGTPQSGTSACTVDFGRTTAVGPNQATGVGAFGFVPPSGSVAIDPWALGLLPGKQTNALLGPNASQITFSFNPTPNLPQGFPTTLTLGDIVGGPFRAGASQFNGLYDFDIYRMPTDAAAYAATSPSGAPVAVTVTYPSSLPINCGGPLADTPPVPPPPTAPVPAFRRHF